MIYSIAVLSFYSFSGRCSERPVPWLSVKGRDI